MAKPNDEWVTIDAMIPLTVGAFSLLASLRMFSKKPDVTRWKRLVAVSYVPIGLGLIALGVWMLVTGKTVPWR